MKRIIAAAFAIAAAACGGGSSVDVPQDAVIQLSDQFSSDFKLVDETGRTVTNDDFKGKLMVVYFGFATCPDVCPMALGTLSAALNELSDKERSKLAALFITVDPERDTPQALDEYLAFDERIIGLTGTLEAAKAAQESFKVFSRKQKLPDSALGYTMDHSSLYYVVDRKGQPQYALQDSLTAQELAAFLRRNI